jgi:hypothetical protein
MTLCAILDRWRRNTPSMRRSPERGRIVRPKGGFDVINFREEKASILWPEVVRIYAFKRDLLTVDLVCLAFQRANASCFEIDENMEGYEALLAQLPVVFKGFDEDWWRKVVKPAFATKLTEVWSGMS